VCNGVSLAGEHVMNWDQIKSDWREVRGKLKERWDKLTESDLSGIAGKRDQLISVLQKRYDYAKEQAEKALDSFVSGLEVKPSPIETTHVRHEPHDVTREELVGLLNEDLAGEYQAIISYVIYSQVLKGAQYMSIAKELETHAAEELSHALTISKQIDYLGGMPIAVPKAVRTSADAQEMLRFDLQNEAETIARYRRRVRQCEAIGEYAIAEHIREILIQEQEHLIDLATALGIEAPVITDHTETPLDDAASPI